MMTFSQWWFKGGCKLVCQAGAKDGWKGAGEVGYIAGLLASALDGPALAAAPQAEAAQGASTGFKLVPIEPTEAMLTAGRCVKGLNRKYAAMVAAAPSPDREQVGEACIAPACHQWDGTDRCTCQRHRTLDTLKRVATALPVLRTMLATEGLGGVEVADEMLSDIRALLGEKADAPPSHECGEQQSFPERDPSKTNAEQGLYRKFEVRRVDGSDATGGKHDGCEYFVLDMTHDAHAPAALRAYAQACASTHPQLSADLAARFGGERQGAAYRYVVIGYGESDYPQAELVATHDELLDAVMGMMYTKPSDADAEIREAYRKDLDDEDEWCGGIWSAEFEIGGITIYDLGGEIPRPIAASAPTPSALTSNVCDVCADGDCLADNAGLPCPFSVSLRSVDECDPQSFINGVKWAREHAAGTPAQQECPHGVDDGACGWCYGEPKPTLVYPQGVMGIPPWTPPGHGEARATDALIYNAAQPQAAEPKGLTEHLYILSANEEAMESAIEAFEGSSEGEGLKSVLYAQKQLCALLAKGE